jgi:CDP-diacylglycerol---glycerol-3-phosphate 3-phosphatidyltransferase
MTNEGGGQPIKIYLTDKIFSRTLLKLVPHSIRPNYLTAVRLIMVPWVALFIWLGNYWVGLILFLAAALTDAMDGALARTRNQITAWGKLFDPLADKFLICTVVFVLVLKYVDFFTAWVIIILESIIVVAALVKKRDGVDIQSNFWGKIKMILQVAGVVFLLLSLAFNFDALIPVSRGSFYMAIAFAIISLFTYSI